MAGILVRFPRTGPVRDKICELEELQQSRGKRGEEEERDLIKDLRRR